MKLILAGAILSVPAACQVASTQKPTKDSGPDDPGFYQLRSNEPVKLGVPIQLIRRSSKNDVLSDAPRLPYTGTVRQYVNPALNSRAEAAFALGVWKIDWTTALPGSVIAKSTLEVGGHVVVEADGVWLLFDAGGKQVSNGELGASGIAIDRDSFYAADSAGSIVSRKLSNGEPNFEISLFFGDEYERTFLHRFDSRLIVVSRERELDPHKSDSKEKSLVELLDLGAPLQTDRDGVLTSAKPIKHLARKTNVLLAASTSEKLVLGTRDRIYTTDLALNFTQALSGEFVPISMSLDEAGRIYILVEKSGRRFLWTISTAGEIISEYELSTEFGRTTHPPVIGFDHSVYLSAADEILSIDQRGKLKWRAKLSAKAAGMITTPNHTLLISAGKELLAFDGEGKRRVIFSFGDEEIVTAPAITADGSVLVASQTHLIKLRPSPAK